jgi:WD40 repeat protein
MKKYCFAVLLSIPFYLLAVYISRFIGSRPRLFQHSVSKIYFNKEETNFWAIEGKGVLNFSPEFDRVKIVNFKHRLLFVSPKNRMIVYSNRRGGQVISNFNEDFSLDIEGEHNFYSLDGNYIFSFKYKTLYKIDLVDTRLIPLWKIKNNVSLSYAFFSEGSQILIIVDDDGGVYLYDIIKSKISKCNASLQAHSTDYLFPKIGFPGAEKTYYPIDLSFDRSHLIAYMHGNLVSINLRNGKTEYAVSCGPVSCIRCSPTDNVFAVTELSKPVQLRDINSGKVVANLKNSICNITSETPLEFSSDGRYIVTSLGRIMLWDLSKYILT